MKNYRKELWFNLPARRAFVNITPEVETCLRESGIQEGLLLCNAMHISASVFINDDERGLHQDFEKWLEKLAPEKPHAQYAHNTGDDNADAHLKRTIMGRDQLKSDFLSVYTNTLSTRSSATAPVLSTMMQTWR